MNKKNISLILIFVMFLSIMVMATIGKNPDKSGVVAATGVIFYDQEGLKVDRVETDEEKRELKTIELKESLDTFYYTFKVEIVPSDTTDRVLNYYVWANKGIVIETVSEPGPYVPDDSLTPEGEEKKEADPVFYEYKITFDVEHQGVTKIQFEYNTNGGGTKIDYLQIIFDVGHEQDLD